LHEAAHRVPVVHVGSDQRHHSLRANQHAMQQQKRCGCCDVCLVQLAGFRPSLARSEDQE
jgi:hypothetical protein